MSASITRTQTIQVASYPDGRRVRILRVSGLGWQWDRGAYSSHKSSAIENAIREGATITREPNPNYRPRLNTFERLTKGTRA